MQRPSGVSSFSIESLISAAPRPPHHAHPLGYGPVYPTHGSESPRTTSEEARTSPLGPVPTSRGSPTATPPRDHLSGAFPLGPYPGLTAASFYAQTQLLAAAAAGLGHSPHGLYPTYPSNLSNLSNLFVGGLNGLNGLGGLGSPYAPLPPHATTLTALNPKDWPRDRSPTSSFRAPLRRGDGDGVRDGRGMGEHRLSPRSPYGSEGRDDLTEDEMKLAGQDDDMMGKCIQNYISINGEINTWLNSQII
jgi:hypothetical protein